MGYIPIKLTKCILYLSEQEINNLLKHDMDLWATALRRGKAIPRAEKQKKREQEKLQKWEKSKLNS